MKNRTCKLMGIFSLFIQVILGIFLLMLLLIKRYYEKPKRKFILFALDTSKQLSGLLIIHCINLLFSYFYGENTSSDECYWYFTSVLIDCTYGIFFNYICLQTITLLMFRLEIDIRTGNYFKKIHLNKKIITEICYKSYFIQLVIWCIIVILMKISVICIQIYFSSYLIIFCDVIFNFFSFSDTNELIFNLVVFPNIMNAIQFLITDNILKKKKFEIEDEDVLDRFYIDNSRKIIV